MFIDGIEYDSYKVKSVTLELDTCMLSIKIIFTKWKNEVVKVKDYIFNTDCDVNIIKLYLLLKKE